MIDPDALLTEGALSKYAQHLPACGRGRENLRSLDIGEYVPGACTCGLDALLARLAQITEERDRLRSGQFTAEEIHDICHNLHGTVDARAFADGCSAEQRKLYGCAPDADALARVIQERDEFRDALNLMIEATLKAEADLARLRAEGETLIVEWRAKAEASRLEASRIHSTVKGSTDAEERCRARAEVWDQVADRLSALFRRQEDQ